MSNISFQHTRQVHFFSQERPHENGAAFRQLSKSRHQQAPVLSRTGRIFCLLKKGFSRKKLERKDRRASSKINIPTRLPLTGSVLMQRCGFSIVKGKSRPNTARPVLSRTGLLYPRKVRRPVNTGLIILVNGATQIMEVVGRFQVGQHFKKTRFPGLVK